MLQVPTIASYAVLDSAALENIRLNSPKASLSSKEGDIMSALPYIQDLLFQSPREIEEACEGMMHTVIGDLHRFIDLSKAQKYDLAYRTWSTLWFRFCSFYLKLDQTISKSTNSAIQGIAQERLGQLVGRVQQILLASSDLRKIFIDNAFCADQLSPDQRRLTAAILRECEGPEFDKARQVLAQYPEAHFSLARGTALPVDGETLSQLSVLSANIICFPEELPYPYGGMPPWKDRMEGLSEVILKADAHVICLQEVWDPEAMHSLIEKLKDHYAYFVYNAGDPSGTMQLEKIGYSSGLFIASKLPLENIDFRRFPRSIPATSNRGALIATCRAGDQIVPILTSHLQHGNDSDHLAVRKEQLQHCYNYLQETLSVVSSDKSLGMVVGDLNIDGFSQERIDSGLSQLFSIPYLDNFSNEDKAVKATSSNYFSDLVQVPKDQRGEVEVSYEILDYCIAPANSINKVPLKQVIIPLFSVDTAKDLLSDHKAKLTIWDLNPS